METRTESGVYIIKNLVNRKVYTGSAINTFGRWYEHKRNLEKNSHCNHKLQNAWNKYGADNFEFAVVRKCSTDKLLPFEQIVMNRFDSVENGYNIAPIAGSSLGIKHSPEARKNMSLAHEGHKVLDATKKKISIAFKGENHPNYGKPLPEWQKIRLSIANTGCIPWNKGIPYSDAVKKKMSDSSKGCIPWNKGKIGVQMPSDATKIKMSDSHKKYWMLKKEIKLNVIK